MSEPTEDARPAHDVAGRFAKGNAGRPRGSRNRGASRMAAALLADFEANEADNLHRLRRWFFPEYVRLMSRFIPKDPGPAWPDFSAYSDDETAAVVANTWGVLNAIQRGEAGLEALAAALERDPRDGGEAP